VKTADRYTGIPHVSGTTERTESHLATAGTQLPGEEELASAARVAWRNAERCIGRLYWRGLLVRDRRSLQGDSAIAGDLIEHLRLTTNNGRVRSVATIVTPTITILNEQLVGYAGYRRSDGSVLGDSRHVEITELALSLGWPGGRPDNPGGSRHYSRFDILPLIIRSDHRNPTWHEIPAGVVREVALRHPDYEWFADLGLQWYATPVITNMPLHLTPDLRYPAAFGGWYLGTELAADADRYDALPDIANRLGLNTLGRRSLWLDRAEHELNRAVLHSFDTAGVTITDHHTESDRFLAFVERERQAGRPVRSDWSWIVPPQASARLGVYHHYQDPPDPEVLPAFRRADNDYLPSTGCPFSG
jgi:nitric-oxide synthase, bacterial